MVNVTLFLLGLKFQSESCFNTIEPGVFDSKSMICHFLKCGKFITFNREQTFNNRNMKRLLLIILFFYSIPVNSQNYIPFPVDSAIWTVDIMSAQGPFGSTTHATVGYSMVGAFRALAMDQRGNATCWSGVQMPKQ